MRKILAIFLSVIVAILGFGVGAFISSMVLESSDIISWILAVLCALAFGFGYFYFRKYKEKCKKCGELWSVRFVGARTLRQSVVRHTEKTGTVPNYNIVVERNRNKDRTPRHYGKKDVYRTTNYLVGEEKLTYRCDKCGNETSKIKKFKRVA